MYIHLQIDICLLNFPHKVCLLVHLETRSQKTISNENILLPVSWDK